MSTSGERIMVLIEGNSASIVRASEQAGAAIKGVGTEAKAASATTARATEAQSAAVGRNLKATGTHMQTFGRSWTRNVSLPVAALGGYAVKSSLDFNKAMALVQTQAGASAKEVEEMRGRILAFSASGKIDQGPTALANALYRVESAGIHGSKAMETLKSSAYLAMVGQSDLELTTLSLVAAQKTGITGAKNLHKAIGTLNATVGAGQMRMNDLVSAMGTGFLISAKQVGLNLSDVGAALAEMTKQGMPAAAAATRLRLSFTLMAAPTDKAKKALKEVGLGANDLAITMRKEGLVPALELLRSHLDGLSKVKQTQILSSAFGGARSGTTIMALVNNTKDLDTTLQHIHQHAGEVGKSIETMRATRAEELKIAWAQAQTELVKFGDALIPVVIPALKEVAGVAMDLSRGFQSLSPAMQGIVVKGLLLAAAIGPLARIFGGMTKGIGGLIGLFGRLGGAQAEQAVVAQRTAVAVNEEAIAMERLALASRGAGVAGGAGAATAAGGAVAGGAATKGGLKGALGKVRWARVGGVGLGLALADATLQEFSRQSQKNAPDFIKALEAATGPKLNTHLGFKIDPGPAVSFVQDKLKSIGGDMPGGDRLGLGLSSEEKNARKLQPILDQVAKSYHGISAAKADYIRQLARESDLGDAPKKNLVAYANAQEDLRAGTDRLKAGVFTSMGQIAKVSSANMKLIAATMGTDSEKGRKAVAGNMRATAAAIKLEMQRSGNVTKAGMQRVHDLIRGADLIGAGESQARGFGREWARGMDHTNEVTAKGIRQMIAEMRQLTEPARQQAANAALARLNAAVRGGDLEVKEYRRIKGRILSTFTDINLGARNKGAGLNSIMKDTLGSLNGVVMTGFQTLEANANKALRGIGAPTISFHLAGLDAASSKLAPNLANGKGKPKGKQTGGGINVPGSGSGDKVHLQAMVEPGEKVFVLNRNASSALDNLQKFNAEVPRFASGGVLGDLGQGVLDQVGHALKSKVTKARAAHAASAVGGGAARGPKGVGTFAGIPMANWVIGALQYAAKHGAAPQPTSGYRSHAYNVGQGRTYFSEHEGTQYPHGAVDFGGYDTGLAMKMAVVRATSRYKYPLLAPIGFHDDGHASGTGHRKGGLLGFAKGGFMPGKYTVKGAAASAGQMHTAEQIMRVIATVHANRLASEAILMAATQESLMGSAGNTFQLTGPKSGTSPGASAYAQGLAWMKTGFYGKGGGLALSHKLSDPGAIAQAVEGSAFPSAYSPWKGEADRWIAGWGGGAAGSALKAAAEKRKQKAEERRTKRQERRRSRRSRKIARQGLAPAMRAQLDQVDGVLERLEEDLDITERTATSEASPEGSDYSKEEKGKLVTLYTRQLIELRERVRKIKAILNALAAQARQAEKNIADATPRQIEKKVWIKGANGKSGHWETKRVPNPKHPFLSAYKDNLSKVHELQGTLSGDLTDTQGITGKGGQIFDVTLSLADLQAQVPAGSTDADSGLADLYKQQLQIAQKNLALSQGQYGVFSEFFRELGAGLPFVGAFAHGGLVPETGVALVHRGEMVIPDPEGPYNNRSGISVGRDTPVDVTLVLHGDAGQLVQLVDARIDGRAAKVVNSQLGREQRRMTVAPGRS